MSYSSRVYRQRNAHSHDEKSKDSFFGKQQDSEQSKSGKSFFQTKLTVNKPGDAFEKEADNVANTVVNKTSDKPIVQQKKISSIQRLATSAEEEKLSTNDARMKMDKDIQEKPQAGKDPEEKKEKLKGVQKKDEPHPDEKKKKKPVQTKAETATAPSSSLSSRIDNKSGKGNPLPDQSLKEMNSSFGTDFSDVSIHTDAEAKTMNKELNAQAFTNGKDIYFNEGKFNPESDTGKNLLAHELTHVVQQNKK